MSEETSWAVCCICQGEARSGLYVDRAGDQMPICARLECLQHALPRHEKIPLVTPYEKEAIAAAAKAGGQRMLEYGGDAIRQLSKEQWRQVVIDIVGVWRARLAELSDAKDPPLL